ATLEGRAALDGITSTPVVVMQACLNYGFTELGPTPANVSKQQLLSTPGGVQQLTGPAGTGVTSVADPFGAGHGLLAGGHYFVTGGAFGHSPLVFVYNPGGSPIAPFFLFDTRFQGGGSGGFGAVQER